MSIRPTRAQWLSALYKPGTQGGCKGQQVDIDRERLQAEHGPAVGIRERHRKTARHFFCRIKSVIKKASCENQRPLGLRQLKYGEWH